MKLSLYDGYFFDSEEIYLVRKNLVTKKKEENLEIEKKMKKHALLLTCYCIQLLKLSNNTIKTF